MKYIIKQYKHRARPLTLGIYVNKHVLRKRVRLTNSCKYYIKEEDQLDTNKLFGLGHTTWWRAIWLLISLPIYALLSINVHHTNSARLGFYFDEENLWFVAYCYVNKERVIQPICIVYPNLDYYVNLRIFNDQYIFDVYDDTKIPIASCSVPKKKTGRFSIPLGPYFGGDPTAPHNIHLEIADV